MTGKTTFFQDRFDFALVINSIVGARSWRSGDGETYQQTGERKGKQGTAGGKAGGGEIHRSNTPRALNGSNLTRQAVVV